MFVRVIVEENGVVQVIVPSGINDGNSKIDFLFRKEVGIIDRVSLVGIKNVFNLFFSSDMGEKNLDLGNSIGTADTGVGFLVFNLFENNIEDRGDDLHKDMVTV